MIRTNFDPIFLSPATLSALSAFDIDVEKGVRGPCSVNGTVSSLAIEQNQLSYLAAVSTKLMPELQTDPTKSSSRTFSSEANPLDTLVRLCRKAKTDHELDLYRNPSVNLSEHDIAFGERDGTVIKSKFDQSTIQVSVLKKMRGLIVQQNLVKHVLTDHPNDRHTMTIKIKWEIAEKFINQFAKDLKDAGESDSLQSTLMASSRFSQIPIIGTKHINMGLLTSSWLLQDDWESLMDIMNSARLYVGDDFDVLDISHDGIISSQTIKRSDSFLEQTLKTHSAPFIRLTVDDQENECAPEFLRVTMTDEGMIIQQQFKSYTQPTCLKQMKRFLDNIHRTIKNSH